MQCKVLLCLFDNPYASNFILAQTLGNITWQTVRNHLHNSYVVLDINLDKSSKIAILLEIERSEIRDQFLDTASRQKRTHLELTTK